MVSRQRLDQPGAITGIARRLRSAERGANLGYSSITRGGMRVASADGLLVQTVAGGLPGLRITGLEVVDGTLRVTGTIEGSGTFTWTGTINQTGVTNLRGPVAITGESGTLTVDAETLLRGVTRMLADMRVEGNGKITVGGMLIDPADGGKITFPGGAQLRADVGDGIQLQIGTVKISAQPGAITLAVGTRSIGISSTNIRAALPTRTVAQAGTGSFPGAVVSDTAGNFFRVTA